MLRLSQEISDVLDWVWQQPRSKRTVSVAIIRPKSLNVLSFNRSGKKKV
jgi:hypothetical protein